MANSEATLILKVKQIGQELLDRFVVTLGDVISIAKDVASALWSTVEAFREEQLAVNELTTAMMNSGTFTGELREEYIQMAAALQDLTTYGDEQIISAQAILQTHIGNKKVTKELVEATLDLAAAKKMDLASAAQLVGKAISGETDVLARAGIHVKDFADQHNRLGNVIDAISSKIGGQAQTMAKDLGVIDQLKNSWSDFLEKVGALIAPTVQGLAAIANGALKVFNAMMPSNFDAAKSSVSGIGQEILKLRRNILMLEDAAASKGGLDAFDKALIAKYEKQIAAHKDAQAKMIEQERQAKEKGNEIDLAAIQRQQENRIAQQVANQNLTTLELEQKYMNDEQFYAAEVARIDREIALAQTFAEKKQLIEDRADQVKLLNKAKFQEAEKKRQEEHDKAMAQAASNFLNHMASLQSSNNSLMAAIGKAAAIASITISTGKAAMDGYAWGMSMGGPALASTFAGLAYAAGAVQVAKVSGVQLAEGGVIKATPGGVPAIIGEGGRDEAVIPLEDGMVPGSGGVSITINGNLIGDEQSLYALAKMLDPQMLKLRQNNESVAFDTGVL